MEDLILGMAVLFAIIMMVLMVKYAKFIHTQPKVEAERRKEQDVGASNLEEDSGNNP
ncbi:MAG: hypothetical protein VW455_05595 [Nitrospinota bacterium]